MNLTVSKTGQVVEPEELALIEKVLASQAYVSAVGQPIAEKEMALIEHAMAAVYAEWDETKHPKKLATYAIARPLYVCRQVLNADEIIDWAKSQGLVTTLPEDDMHVTVCFSKEPVDWLALDHADETLEIPPEGIQEYKQKESDFKNRIVWNDGDIEVVTEVAKNVDLPWDSWEKGKEKLAKREADQKAQDAAEGVWRTVNGRKIFLKPGEDATTIINQDKLDDARGDYEPGAGYKASQVLRDVFRYPPPEIDNKALVALDDYLGSSFGINGTLRNQIEAKPGLEVEALGLKQVLSKVDALDKVFSGLPATKMEVNVSRAIPAKVFKALGIKAGTVFKDKGFVSTSLSRVVVDKLFSGNEKMFFDIKIAPGAKVLSIPSVNGLGSSFQHAEAELLLPRGSAFKISSIKGNTVTAELLPHGQYAEFKFDPSQPRDDQGQWTSVGGMLRQHLKEKNGFTYRPIGHKVPTTGKSLSMWPGREKVFLRMPTRDEIKTYIANNKDILNKPGHYVGAWYDCEHGKVYLDITKVVQTDEEAKALSIKYKQEAYYDLGTGQEVRVRAREYGEEAGVRFVESGRDGSRDRRVLGSAGRYEEVERSVITLGDDGAIVLRFESRALQARHQYFKDHGASWDYDGYHPHITLTYEPPEGFDPAAVQPYTGKITLGPELFEEIQTKWADSVKENAEDGTNGKWVTVNGRHVFIKEGEDLQTALAHLRTRHSRGHLIFNPKRDAIALQELIDGGVSKAEAKGLISSTKAYTNYAYKGINSVLSAGVDPLPEMRGQINRVDKFLNTAPLYKGKSLYRGTMMSEERINALQPGSVFEHKTYVSTSSSPKVAQRFLKDRVPSNVDKDRMPVLMKINKYQRGVSVATFAKWVGENEVLFPRGTKFRVTGMQRKTKHVELNLEEV